jgi:hypothetical protein
MKRTRTSTRKDSPRRRSRTREEYIASLRWNIKDATEALRHAVDMRRWSNVIRYARQLESLEEKLVLAETSRRRIERVQETMGRERLRRTHPTTEAEERARLRRAGWSVSGTRRRA